MREVKGRTDYELALKKKRAIRKYISYKKLIYLHIDHYTISYLALP